jgi:hypothetical protein
MKKVVSRDPTPLEKMLISLREILLIHVKAYLKFFSFTAMAANTIKL